MSNIIYIVAKNFNKRGSTCYAMQNEIEQRSLFGAMESIRSENMQIVIMKGLTEYPEYSPYNEVETAKEFVSFVLEN